MDEMRSGTIWDPIEANKTTRTSCPLFWRRKQLQTCRNAGVCDRQALWARPGDLDQSRKRTQTSFAWGSRSTTPVSRANAHGDAVNQ